MASPLPHFTTHKKRFYSTGFLSTIKFRAWRGRLPDGSEAEKLTSGNAVTEDRSKNEAYRPTRFYNLNDEFKTERYGQTTLYRKP